MDIRVLVVDPEPFFCEALAVALPEHGCIVVGWAIGEREAVDLAATTDPNVVFAEVELEGGAAFALARRLGRTVPVVVLTRRDEGSILLDSVAAGAAGCVTHHVDVAGAAALARQASSGRFAIEPDRLGPALADAVARLRGKGDPPEQRLASLTVRELEVLDLVAQGRTNAEISAHLHLSAHTVRTHVGNILHKTEAHSRAEVARLLLSMTDGRRSVRIDGPDLPRRQP